MLHFDVILKNVLKVIYEF